MSKIIKVRAWDSKEFLPLAREIAFIDDEGVLCSRIEGIVFSQFTGLTDKDGKEIWEGDILSWSGFRGVVFWDEHFAAWRANAIGSIGTIQNLEVIGNRYENEDLVP